MKAIEEDAFSPTRGLRCPRAGDAPAEAGARASKTHSRAPVLFRSTSTNRFSSDQRAHTFLMAGLLLVMGTVTLGGVYVTMGLDEEAAVRDQRDHLMEPVAGLVSRFNESVQSMVHPGETNISVFKERLASLEERVHMQAAKEGFYLTMELDEDADPSFWTTDGRCPSYDPHRSEGAVVIGHAVDGRQASIVGAALAIEATDGQQLVRFPYYLKLQDCLPDRQVATFNDIRILDGWALNPTHGQKANDNNAAMRLGELPKGQLVFSGNASQDPATLDWYGWNNEHHPQDDDGKAAHHPATPHADYLMFQMDLSGLPADLVLEDVRVDIHAWEIDAPNDYLEARAIHNGVVLHTWNPPLTGSEEVFSYDLPISPSGKPYWTVPELADLFIEFKVIEPNNKFDPNAFFYVEYAEYDYNYTAPERYAFEGIIEWPVVPTLYGHHTVEMRYRYEPETAGETFHLQVKEGGTWETRLVIDATGGGWAILEYSVLASEIEDGILEMRLVDSLGDDRWAQDGDELEIDYLLLRSGIEPS